MSNDPLVATKLAAQSDAQEPDEGVQPPQATIPKERPGPKGGHRDLNRRERVRTLLEWTNVALSKNRNDLESLL
ncbi:MAG: hypothetical protein HOK97_01830 [Deltaproteobacteria bacterium]|nr:hypothetical protein [Deltaproteobacteria bacterium]